MTKENTESLLKASKEESKKFNEESATEQKAFKRPKKKLMEGGGPLHCKPMEGFHLRWVTVNDHSNPTNMSWAEGQNYVPVTPKEQGLSEYERSSDPTHSGSDIRRTGKDGITSILMKQPVEDYEESIREITEINDKPLKGRAVKAPQAIGTFGNVVSLNTIIKN